MDLVRLAIPAAYVRNRVQMSWRDLLFGIDQELLDLAAPIDFAIEALMANATANPTVVDLAGLTAGEDTRPYVERLAIAEPEKAAKETRNKWLYVVLAWILEHKDSYAKPLEAVAEVYADFQYPKRIAEFVYYMPSDEPDLGSRELNEARLYAKWQAYLDECSSVCASKLGA